MPALYEEWPSLRIPRSSQTWTKGGALQVGLGHVQFRKCWRHTFVILLFLSRLALRYRGILRALEDNATLATDPSTSTSSSSNVAHIDPACTEQDITVNQTPRDHSDSTEPNVVQTRSRQKALALSNPIAVLANVSLVPETRPPSPVANDDPFHDLLANPATYFSKGESRVTSPSINLC